MYKKLAFLLILFLNLDLQAQVRLEKGYYIDNSNSKIDCFIKNEDWKNNPTTFEMKLKDSNQIITKSIEEIKEFGVENVFKYSRFDVKIDFSETKVDRILFHPNPEFKTKTIFLKTLVEGEATLYQYCEEGINKYFYKTNNVPVEQLIFKNYLDDAKNIIENKKYQAQLLENVQSNTTPFTEIIKLKYTRQDLTNHFIKFNEKQTSKATIYEAVKQGKSTFNAKLKVGISNNSLQVNNKADPDYPVKYNVGGNSNIVFGVELECILPFNRNKWSLIFDPNYQTYKAESDETVRFRNYPYDYDGIKIRNWKVNYSYINLPIGVRYYMFLNQNSKISFDASLLNTVYLKSKIVNSDQNEFDSNGRKFQLSSGIGYTYKNKYQVHLKISNHNSLAEYAYWYSNYFSSSLSIG